MHSFCPPTEQTKRHCCVESNILTSQSAHHPWGPTPGTSCHNARPPDLPPGPPCLQAHRMCVCVGVLLIMHLCICLYGAYVAQNGTVLQLCVYACVCRCLSEEGVRGGGIHQISYLIWAASGGVKGAVGRLSSRRRKRETESRWRECERR